MSTKATSRLLDSDRKGPKVLCPSELDNYDDYDDDGFLISNFRRVLNIVCILLGISPASDCGLPTFQNPLSVPSSRAGCRV